jgi:molybdenum cofactor biosynthesis enzyme MoaA
MKEDLQHPVVPLEKLDELWFQITGTRCNLECTHCFISCSPTNTSFGNLDRAEVERRLEESKAFGVKDYYFTGGEPFLHPEIVEILAAALQYGPVTVLTNGTVMTPAIVDALRQAVDASMYSLELRVSIDHFDEAKNDAIRGDGSFRLAMRGVSRLAAGGFLPIITAMRTWELDEDLDVLDELAQLLRGSGVDKPRIKILPSLKMGAEAERDAGYEDYDFVTEDMMVDFPVGQLTCSHSRVVTDRGIHVCPILIESPDSVLGQSLEEATQGFALRHQACSTCYLFGAFCINPAGILTETGPKVVREWPVLEVALS